MQNAVVRSVRKPLHRSAKPYLFMLPILLFSVAFVYYPFGKTFLYAFSSVNFRGQITGFVGFDNFSYLFGRKDFKTALLNTLKLTALNVPLTLIITISLAALANRKRRLSGVYETLFTLPMAVSMSAAALIFKVLLNPTVGYVNYALGLSFKWYEGKNTAMYGVLALTVWMGIGFDFLLFLSAFRAIPDQLNESAMIDGAGVFSRFFLIELPLITPTILYVTCTNTVLALMTSGPIMIIIKDSLKRYATTLIYMMYSSGYQSSDYGVAACISIITFLLSLLFTCAAFALERKKVHYQ